MMLVRWQCDKMTTAPLSEKLIQELRDFGLSGNEAKVYLALLQLRKANARTIAKLSNVPRQEIYRVLPRLERSGMTEVIVDKPTKFLAIDPPEVLSELIKHKQETTAKQIHELRMKKSTLENELKKIEGKSSALIRAEPVRFAVISGQHLINEKLQEMLHNSKSEVLWMVPKLEIRRAVIYDRDKMLRECAQRNVKVKILTEIDEKNLGEVRRLSKFCEIRHVSGLTSLTTIIDNKELMIGSAVHAREDLTEGELMHELWTNDISHISVMSDFFEKLWRDSVPAKLEIESIRSGKALRTITIVQGYEKVKKRVLDSIAGTQSRLFIVSQLDDASISLVSSQLDTLQKRNTVIRWVTVADKQTMRIAERLATKVNLLFLKERPLSFLVTDSDCIFASTSILQIPNEIVWSIDRSTINMFWALAEELWSTLSEKVTKYQ
jgi:sugar-specific transcriptional regulator TrmB